VTCNATNVNPAAALETDLQLGTNPGRVIALVGALNGKYPSGTSVLVAGKEESLLIDPSITVAERGGVPGCVDRMLVSHAHEDHLAGCSTFPDTPVHAHHDDLLGLQSVDGMLTVYGFEEPIRTTWTQTLIDDFHYLPRPDATGFADGHRFDLGGSMSVTVVHLPGHTRGHCGFMIEPDGVFFVADIDLTGFGPYYGDHWSDLEDFERSIDHVATIDAKHYVTFHHKGIISTRSEFLTQLAAFRAVISSRDHKLVAFLSEPHSLDEIAGANFIYRPGSAPTFAEAVERRSMSMHLTRLLRDGVVLEAKPGLFRAT
jgi:glyoxylase-like metal-dependent hydrolase (beta-lactamase superfamily II)